MKTLMTRTLHIFALLSLAALICGQLGRLCWFAELFSHFLPYYAAVFLLAACLPRGKYWCGFWTVATLASILWLLHPLSLANAPPTGERLIWYNVHLNNPDAAGESAALLAEKADILALAEIDLDNPGWQRLRAHYPHGCQHQEASPFALALWSAEPLASCDIAYSSNFPYIRATTTDGTVLYALHPPPPISSALAAARIAYLHDTAARIAAEPRLGSWRPQQQPLFPTLPRFPAHKRHHGDRPLSHPDLASALSQPGSCPREKPGCQHHPAAVATFRSPPAVRGLPLNQGISPLDGPSIFAAWRSRWRCPIPLPPKAADGRCLHDG